ncbi:RFX DNA-binding domain-domain-containing protein [Absidia repens]|uniref:RFX DNA-binding domain-domain-containing protein n=1 Tax=Absidia repens TaxID=90262 RepID=A0A1X2IAU6_9FUNG|nr:RFX DNA-binding domain-domain-containing protein [Absidia repens]
MAEKGKRPQTRSMQTRSSVVPIITDDKPASESTSPPDLQTDIHSPEQLHIASQAMTNPDPGSSSAVTFKERHGLKSEESVHVVTVSKSRVSPPTSVADSSASSTTTSTSSKDVTRFGSMANNGVVSWILENYEVRPNSNVPRSGIYEHYKYYCTLQHVRPVNAATFGKLIRIAFPHMSTRRLGNRGQSKYQYCNIQRRELPESSTDTLVDISATTTTICKAAGPSSAPYYTSVQQHHQTSNVTTESSTSISNANDSVQSTLFSYPVAESASLSSPVTSSTQPGSHAFPPLQLPSPFGLIPSLSSSSSSPPLLPQQHHLSNFDLVSIFSSPSSVTQHQDTSISAPSRSLATTSSSTLLAGPETFITRRFNDFRDTSGPTAQFANLYNQHCQDIYNTIFAGEFEKVSSDKK